MATMLYSTASQSSKPDAGCGTVLVRDLCGTKLIKWQTDRQTMNE